MKGRLKVVYANFDELLLAKLEVNNLLKESKLDVMCLVKTKLNKDMLLAVGDNNFRV